MVFASKPVASLIRFAARPVGAHSRMSTPLADRMRRIAVDDRRLADARPAGNHRDLRGERRPDRLGLAGRQSEPGPPFHPGQRLVGIDPGP